MTIAAVLAGALRTDLLAVDGLALAGRVGAALFAAGGVGAFLRAGRRTARRPVPVTPHDRLTYSNDHVDEFDDIDGEAGREPADTR